MTKRLLFGSLFAGIALVLSFSGMSTADEKTEKGKGQTIKQVMKLCFDDEEGLLESLTTLTKEASPKWDTISQQTKSWVSAAESLGKNKPKKGTPESWEKLTKKFVEDGKTLDVAAGKKESKDVLAALKTIEGACKGCHPVHK